MSMSATGGSEDGGSRVLGRRRRPPPPTSSLDATTGLPDRTNLLEWAEEAIERSLQSSKRALIAFVDIGQLRDVNDAFGADTGDYLLRSVGARLASIDLPGTRVGRYGGAEFVLVFENIETADMADEVGRFLLELLAPGFQLGNEEFTITPTVGMAISSDNYRATRDLLGDAHRALVRARDQGPRTYELHDETKRGRYETRVDESRLATAIDKGEFLLAYQPIVRLDNREPIGFEALIRWQQPGATTTGVLMPHDFMPLLEKTGMSVRVGDWVIHEACRQAAEWNRLFPDRPALFITCNIGARQLASADFYDSVLSAVRSARVQPWQLCLDITEDALRYNRTTAWSALRRLKDHGVKLGLDDFGTGVSSLTYLREFTLDLLRVDRTFVENVPLSREDQVIVKHIAGLAHDLGLIAVAEGVENDEQVKVLQSLTVDLAQGYRFGRPQFAPETTALLDPAGRPDAWSPASITTYGRER
jgi:diguanylate cyclase (GGDEF)-like protein